MFSRRRLISHLVLWGFVVAGIILSFHSIDPGIVFKKAFNKWLVIFFLVIFLIYHITTAAYYHCRLSPSKFSEKKIVREGHYGKCVHPTCTTLIILSWILFFYYPDWRIFFSAAWLTAIILFWIHIEKSFFSGRRSEVERKKPEPA